MKRGILIGGGLIVIAIVAIVAFVFSNLDSLVKTAVETFGSDITGARVTLSKVEISTTDGKGKLTGLTLGNPKGFETSHAVKVGAASVQIDVATITKDTVVIKEVRITAPDVIFEHGGGGSNFDAIQKNVEKFTGSSGGGTGGKTSDKSGDGPKLIIENFIITGGTVNVSASVLAGKRVTVPLPNIHLRDIGKKSKGATAGEVAEQVLAAISGGAGSAVATLGLGLGSAAEAVTGVVTEGVKGAAGIVGEGVRGAAGIVGEGVRGAAGIVEEGVKGGASALGGALKGVFGGGDKK